MTDDRLIDAHGVRRIPSLDGLRAVGLALVIFEHIVGTRNFPVQREPESDIGELGLFLFFVLSGFLITGLLQAERAAAGSISFSNFYARRALRIFPAFYVYLAAIAVLAAAHVIELNPGDLRAAFTYTVNFHANASNAVAHFWSVSTEEQFYIVWPLIMAFFPDAIAAGAAGLCVAFPLIRYVLAHAGINLWFFPDGMNMIAAGCLLAFLRPSLHASKVYTAIMGRMWSGLLIPAAYFAVATWPRPHFLLGVLFGPSLALFIDSCITHDKNRVGRFLNWKGVAFVGTMGYSIYIWQSLFLNRYMDVWWTSFPTNIVLAAAVATASFFLFERPVIALRRRLHQRAELASPARAHRDPQRRAHERAGADE